MLYFGESIIALLMSLAGVTYDERLELSEFSENFMRDYFTDSGNEAHFRVALPKNQYLLYSSDSLPEDIADSEVNSDYFLLEESGNIKKGEIRPDIQSDYKLVYLNGQIREEEISWEQAEEIISAI